MVLARVLLGDITSDSQLNEPGTIWPRLHPPTEPRRAGVTAVPDAKSRGEEASPQRGRACGARTETNPAEAPNHPDDTTVLQQNT